LHFHITRQCEVPLVDGNAAWVHGIEGRGLTVNEAAPRRVYVARASRELYDSGAVFLFVKAVDTLRALRTFAGELNPSTPIVSLQNGVGNADAIKTALGGAVPVVLGITTESSLTVAPGAVRSSEQGSTIIGSGGAAPATSRNVAHMLIESGLRASVVYDIRPHLWGKLVANAAINAVSAILDCEAGAIQSDANAAHLAEALAEEAAAVAAALHINLPFANPWQYVTEVVAIGADTKSSMAFDLESGHPSEIDHINGAVAAAGRRTGVPTPYNDAMVRLVKAKESLRRRLREPASIPAV